MIHIVTDSMSDLTQEESAALGVELLPLTVRFDNLDLREGIDISRSEFFQRLRSSSSLPKTSQIPPEGYRDCFLRLLKNPNDEILCICGSSKISGCYQSALIARDALGIENAEKRIRIVDSLIAISGEALLVRMAAQQRRFVSSAAELEAWVNELRDHQRTYGAAGNLKYLVMGGRLSPLVAKVGSTLNIIPMLRFTGGEILQAGIVRGEKRMIPWYAEKLAKHPPRLDCPLTIAGADCPEKAERTACELQRLAEEKGIPLPPVSVMGVGAVIGTHVGPDLISVSWIEK